MKIVANVIHIVNLFSSFFFFFVNYTSPMCNFIVYFHDFIRLNLLLKSFFAFNLQNHLFYDIICLFDNFCFRLIFSNLTLSFKILSVKKNARKIL